MSKAVEGAPSWMRFVNQGGEVVLVPLSEVKGFKRRLSSYYNLTIAVKDSNGQNAWITIHANDPFTETSRFEDWINDGARGVFVVEQ